MIGSVQNNQDNSQKSYHGAITAGAATIGAAAGAAAGVLRLPRIVANTVVDTMTDKVALGKIKGEQKKVAKALIKQKEHEFTVKILNEIDILPLKKIKNLLGKKIIKMIESLPTKYKSADNKLSKAGQNIYNKIIKSKLMTLKVEEKLVKKVLPILIVRTPALYAAGGALLAGLAAAKLTSPKKNNAAE